MTMLNGKLDLHGSSKNKRADLVHAVDLALAVNRIRVEAGSTLVLLLSGPRLRAFENAISEVLASHFVTANDHGEKECLECSVCDGLRGAGFVSPRPEGGTT